MKSGSLRKKLAGRMGWAGLTARNGMRLQAAFDGFATLVDASDIVSSVW